MGDVTTSGTRTFATPLGTTTVGALSDSNDSNSINATRFTTTSGGKVVSLAAYVGPVDASVARRSFQMGIYTANGNVPGTLVASSATGTLVGNSWNSVAVTATLAPNTAYFFAYNTNGTTSGVNNLRYSNTGVSGWKSGGAAFGTWPTTFGSFSPQTGTFSMFASFASDVTPPTVAISGPADGAGVTGIVTITANASDDTAVSSVQFAVGGTNLGPETHQSPIRSPGTREVSSVDRRPSPPSQRTRWDSSPRAHR